MSKPLVFGNWSECSNDAELRESLMSDFQVSYNQLEGYNILAAGYWYENYEGNAWVLVRSRDTGDLMEVHGSHCSCNGLENQWQTTVSNLAYICSSHFFVANLSDQEKDDLRALLSFDLRVELEDG
jgi:hypothetical protein